MVIERRGEPGEFVDANRSLRKLGIEIPIIQAPMGGAVGPPLAAAVSNAGGLGTLALWRADIETLRKQVRETRSLTIKPFAVNLNLEFPQEERLEVCLQEGVPVIAAGGIADWRGLAAALFGRLLSARVDGSPSRHPKTYT